MSRSPECWISEWLRAEQTRLKAPQRRFNALRVSKCLNRTELLPTAQIQSSKLLEIRQTVDVFRHARATDGGREEVVRRRC